MSKESTTHTILLNRARAHERNHQVEEARALYEQILRENPRHKKAGRALASLTAAATRTAPPLTEADFNRVLTLARTNLQQAEAEAARLCRLHPGQPALENLHGVIMVRGGAPEPAVNAFRRALAVEPGFTDAISNLASALSALNREEEAVICFERLLSAKIRDPEIFYNYGNSLGKLGRDLEAVNAYKNSLNLRPLSPGAYNNMGKALSRLGHPEQAQTCYENALEIDPANDAAARNLARLHSAAARFGEAKALYEGQLSRNPQDVDALFSLAICQINMGERVVAIESLERVLELNASAPAPQFLLDALRGVSRDAAPAEYTRGLFNDYAESFEHDLTVKLEYQAPTLLRGLLEQALPAERHYTNTLDIGCGTGLAGDAFRSLTNKLTGIDLSSEMLSKAAEKRIYDSLLTGDVVELLGNSEDAFDLVLCCDVLPYHGDLAPLFEAVAARTQVGGHFLCTTEQADSGNYTLQASARFAHATDYIIQCASAAGFDAVAQKVIKLRKERADWISGGIYCFARRG